MWSYSSSCCGSDASPILYLGVPPYVAFCGRCFNRHFVSAFLPLEAPNELMVRCCARVVQLPAILDGTLGETQQPELPRRVGSPSYPVGPAARAAPWGRRCNRRVCWPLFPSLKTPTGLFSPFRTALPFRGHIGIRVRYHSHPQYKDHLYMNSWYKRCLHFGTHWCVFL